MQLIVAIAAAIRISELIRYFTNRWASSRLIPSTVALVKVVQTKTLPILPTLQQNHNLSAEVEHAMSHLQRETTE